MEGDDFVHMIRDAIGQMALLYICRLCVCELTSIGCFVIALMIYHVCWFNFKCILYVMLLLLGL